MRLILTMHMYDFVYTPLYLLLGPLGWGEEEEEEVEKEWGSPH